jgi:ubiquinone biosynthesis protein
MSRQIAPDHDYMASFREQYSRLTVKHLSLGSIKDKTGRFARDIARLMRDGPSDTRRILRRMSEGDLGRLPRLEAMAERLSRNVERLAGSIIYAALVVSGALLSLAPNGGGGRHLASFVMTSIGVIGMLVTILGATRRS